MAAGRVDGMGCLCPFGMCQGTGQIAWTSTGTGGTGEYLHLLPILTEEIYRLCPHSFLLPASDHAKYTAEDDFPTANIDAHARSSARRSLLGHVSSQHEHLAAFV